jgi:heavy metal sensor kinase
VKHLGIRAKLTLFYAALFGLALGGAAAVFYHAMTVRLEHSVNQKLDHLCTGLWGYVEVHEGRPALHYNTEDHDVLYFVRTASEYFQLYDGSTGMVLLQSEDSRLMHLVLSPEQARARMAAPGMDEVTSSGTRLRFASKRFRSDGQEFLLRVGLSLDAEEAARQEMLRVLAWLVPVSVTLAALAGWLMARHALRPVQQFQAAAHEISISQLDRRLPLRRTGDELDSLAHTFNEVFSRLQESVAKMKQFTASISHELRTPLACLHAAAETALLRPELSGPCRQVLVSQLEELEKLRRLIERLLILARAEAGEIPLAVENFDLSALLAFLVEEVQPIAAAHKIALEFKQASHSISLAADRQWLEHAILNLLDNAIKFTPGGGRVLVESKLEDGWAVVDVSDTGIGIPQHDQEHIFDRFYRLDASRSSATQGSGLGLSLAKWIVEAHAGRIEVTSELGVGTCFRVKLPLAVSTASLKAHA